MAVSVRADLAAIPDYVVPIQPPGAILLNSNEIPLPPPTQVVAAIIEAAASVNRYPSWFSDELVGALARRIGEEPKRITIGCGSVSLCQQLIQAFCGPAEEVVCAWRSFEAYPVLAQVVGARKVTVPLTANYRHDLSAMLDAISERTRVVFVCNPNNPTGTAAREEELERFLDAVPSNVLVVLDEAYREFVTDPAVPDGLRLARERENMAVLRTFSKAYGLAGVRIGYCVAAPPVIRGLNKVGVPFAVSRLAQAAALATLDVEAELLERCAVVTDERDRMRAALLGEGFEVAESQTNFVWLPLGDAAESFTDHCASQKVIVRRLGDGVRVTVGLPEENEAFLAAARAWHPRR